MKLTILEELEKVVSEIEQENHQHIEWIQVLYKTENGYKVKTLIKVHNFGLSTD